MKIRSVVAILLRVVSLYFLYLSIIGVLRVYLQFSNGNSSITYEISIIYFLLEIILPLLGFIWLWFLPNSLAHKIVSKSNDVSIESMQYTDWLRIIIISIGLYFLTNAMLDCIYWLSSVVLMYENDAILFMTEQKAAMLTTLAELIMGLILITKNYWITISLLKINAPEKPNKEYSED